jgi:hypothetical protein
MPMGFPSKFRDWFATPRRLDELVSAEGGDSGGIGGGTIGKALVGTLALSKEGQ